MDGPDYEWNEEIIGEMKSPYAVLDKYVSLHSSAYTICPLDFYAFRQNVTIRTQINCNWNNLIELLD